jgi:hypothetical protein
MFGGISGQTRNTNASSTRSAAKSYYKRHVMAAEDDTKVLTLGLTNLSETDQVVSFDYDEDEWEPSELMSTLMTAIVGVITENNVPIAIAKDALEAVLESIKVDVKYDA